MRGHAGGTAVNIFHDHRIISARFQGRFRERERVARGAGNGRDIPKFTPVFQPLIRQRIAAGGRHRERGAAARGDKLTRWLAGNDWRDIYGNTRAGAGHAADHIGDHDKIAGYFIRRQSGDGQNVGGGTGNISALRQRHARLKPLVTQRPGACRRDREHDGTAQRAKLIGRLRGDARRHLHRQNGVCARDTAAGIADHHGITRGVRRGRTPERQRRGGGAGNGDAVLAPLIRHRCGAAGCDGKRGGAASSHGHTRRLRENCRRHQHGQRRGGTRERADDVGDHDGITGRVIRGDDGKRKDV